MILKKNLKRLGLFVFFDKENIVDDYVIYLLNDLNQNFDHLTIMSNSPLNSNELTKLKRFTNDIVFRENMGLDAGALFEYFNSSDEYLNYDEVVCFNDTFFGPFYSFKNVFDQMNKEDIDFWGLTLGHKQIDGFKHYKDGYIPEHIQTFFIAFRSSVINSEFFNKYWKMYNYNDNQSFVNVVTNHETSFTQYLASAGFKYDVYVKDENVSKQYYNNYNNYNYNSSDQIIISKAPFIKRKNLVFPRYDMLYLTDSNDLRKSLSYIKKNTNYDVSLIWKNILRIYPLSQIKSAVGFNKIIDKANEKYSMKTYIYNDQFVYSNKFDNYLKNIEDYKLYTSSSKIYTSFKSKNIEIYKINEDNWQNKFYNDIKEDTNEYIGYIYLKKDEQSISLISESIADNYFDNLFQTRKYISGVLNEFKEDKSLGIVYPPKNLHNHLFFDNLIWNKDILEPIQKLLPKSKINCYDIPITISNAFIAKRKELLKANIFQYHFIKNDLFSNILCQYLPYYFATISMHLLISINKYKAENMITNLDCIYQETYKGIYSNNYFPLTASECIQRFRYLKLRNSLIRRCARFAKRLIKKIFKHQGIRFLFVGGLNTIVGYGVYALLLWFGVNYLIANTISTIVGVTHSYLWNRFFTFKSRDKASEELMRFISVYLLSYFIGMGTLYLFKSILNISPYVAGFINIFITTLISWFGHKYFSFRRKK